jgi:hypothetical protein
MNQTAHQLSPSAIIIKSADTPNVLNTLLNSQYQTAFPLQIGNQDRESKAALMMIMTLTVF